MNLIAFRLTSGASTGSIRPVIMTYDGSRPMIPIRPTAVAARDDMGVLVWVIGNARAIPVNYRDLQLNEARINWFDPNSNYRDVINAAANEAGGHGFVTEASGPLSSLGGLLLGTQTRLERLEEYRYSVHEDVEILRRVATQSWRFDDGFNEAMLSEGKVPSREALQAFLDDPYGSDPTQFPDWASFDRGKLLDALRDNVVVPNQATEALFASGTYTRLFTTMSASEMTVDPVFDFNQTAPAVNGVHALDIHYKGCSLEAPWSAQTAAGYYIEGMGRTWPASTQSAPATARIMQAYPDKHSEVVRDNTLLFPKPSSGSVGYGSNGANGAGPSGGCSLTPAGQGDKVVWIGAATMAAWLLRRKRRGGKSVAR